MVNLILSLILLSFAVYSSALIIGDVPLNYTHVCDPARFLNIGLDMSEFTYCDKTLPYDVRAKDLVSRMTLSEKVEQMGDNATGVMRIGLPAYEWWSEALHGVSDVGGGSIFGGPVPGATSFPLVIHTAATFNRTLWKKIGQTISNEARAMHNLGQAGLTFWSPNINVVRDPRWGRILETPGEDPYVVGTYAANFVRGLQDIEGTENTTDPNFRPLKVSACCKHYTAYDVDNWKGVERYTFDARVAEQDMMETFQPPFEMCVKDGDASSVMCSYNKVNGFPTCADHRLLKQTVRDDWNLHGYIVSDCDSIDVMVKAQQWLGDSYEDASAQTLLAGLDLDCGGSYRKGLAGAVFQGQISESKIDESLKYLYIVLMRLGFFDGRPEYASLTKSDVCSSAALELAEEAAKEGIVLLKNENATLPLSSSQYKKLAVIGPHANATKAMIGNYAGIPCRYITPIIGFSTYANVTYATGCVDVLCKNTTMHFAAVEAAKNADATVIVAGLDLSVEAESLDRVDLNLPGYQKELIVHVAESVTGPVILVIMSAGGVDISFAMSHPKIKAILWAGYPGQEGGRAIADVVYGKYNPGGRLPLTWHKADYVNQLPMTSMKLRPIKELGYPGRTYKFFDGQTVFPFAYGLSYTKFEYKTSSSEQIIAVNINLAKNQHCRHVNYTNPEDEPKTACHSVVVEDLACKEKVMVRVAVQNVGKIDGSEVVMAYSKPPRGIEGTHMKQVVGFERVFVEATKTADVLFEFDVCKSFAIVDAVGYKVVPSGVHGVMIGDGDSAVSFKVKINFGQ